MSEISEAFEDFHRENPKVYVVLVRLARQWVDRFPDWKLGIAMLFERARWEIVMATRGDEFKLNNSYRAYYARLMMDEHEDLAGLFDLRMSEADEWIRARQAIA